MIYVIEQNILNKVLERSNYEYVGNFYHCDCDMNDVINTATENPYMVFKDGYGVSDCNINDSNKLRIWKSKKIS